MAFAGRAGFASSVFALLLPLAGCSTAIKQVYYEVRGAKSDIMLISQFQSDTLAAYQSLRFEPATTTVGDRICPPRLLHHYDEQLADASRELRDAYPGGDPALRITTELLYFQNKGLLSGALLLARSRMYDATDDRLVVDALILTESKSFREGSRGDLAESSVKALRRFLRERQAPRSELLDEL